MKKIRVISVLIILMLVLSSCNFTKSLTFKLKDTGDKMTVNVTDLDGWKLKKGDSTYILESNEAKITGEFAYLEWDEFKEEINENKYADFPLIMYGDNAYMFSAAEGKNGGTLVAKVGETVISNIYFDNVKDIKEVLPHLSFEADGKEIFPNEGLKDNIHTPAEPEEKEDDTEEETPASEVPTEDIPQNLEEHKNEYAVMYLSRSEDYLEAVPVKGGITDDTVFPTFTCTFGDITNEIQSALEEGRVFPKEYFRDMLSCALISSEALSDQSHEDILEQITSNAMLCNNFYASKPVLKKLIYDYRDGKNQMTYLTAMDNVDHDVAITVDLKDGKFYLDGVEYSSNALTDESFAIMNVVIKIANGEIEGANEELPGANEELPDIDEVDEPANPNPPQVSGSWMDMKGTIDDLNFAIPFKVKDLINNGWKFEDSRYEGGYTLNSMDTTSGTITLIKDGIDGTLWIGVRNPSDSAIDILDSDVWSLSYNAFLAKNPANFMLSSGAKLGMSVDEVKSLYGEPQDSYTGTGYEALTYGSSWEDGYDGKIVDFRFMDGVLTEIQMQEYF